MCKWFYQKEEKHKWLLHWYLEKWLWVRPHVQSHWKYFSIPASQNLVSRIFTHVTDKWETLMRFKKLLIKSKINQNIWLTMLIFLQSSKSQKNFKETAMMQTKTKVMQLLVPYTLYYYPSINVLPFTWSGTEAPEQREWQKSSATPSTSGLRDQVIKQPHL